MRSYQLGEGTPKIAVVAVLHGDEPCGRRALERLKESQYSLQQPVKLVVANEKAMSEGKRFLDRDLNRCFPGDPNSELHEEKLAAELMDELKGLKTLVLHSMEGFEEPFCLFNGSDEDLIKACRVEKAVDVSPLEENSIERYLDAVSVEAGQKGSEEAERNAYKIVLNFLAYFDVIEKKPRETNPEIFEIYEVVEGDYRFLAENFQKVEEGEKFAEKNSSQKKASEEFYPILMSSDQYEEILGFKGRKLGKLGERLKDKKGKL